jgi:hypothetical protein
MDGAPGCSVSRTQADDHFEFTVEGLALAA